MSVWLARAGKNGENEALAIENNVVTIGWNELGDLSSVKERQDLYDVFEATYPDAGKGRSANHVGQLWAFRARFEIGDLVVLPLKTQSAIAIGKITGDYKYRTDLGDSAKHTRPVEWLKTDLPRTTFDQDLLHSFGAFMTVCEGLVEQLLQTLRISFRIGRPVSFEGANRWASQPKHEPKAKNAVLPTGKSITNRWSNAAT